MSMGVGLGLAMAWYMSTVMVMHTSSTSPLRVHIHRSGTGLARAPAGTLVVSASLHVLTPATLRALATPSSSVKSSGRGAPGAAALASSRVEHVPVIGFRAPASPAGGWLLVLTDSSCLEDDGAPEASPAEGSCTFLLVEVLRATLLGQSVSATGSTDMGHMGTPPVLADAERLRGAVGEPSPVTGQSHATGDGVPSSGHPASLTGAEAVSELMVEGLNAAQASALRSQSRVWAALSGCARTGEACAAPLVPPPTWRRATMRGLQSSSSLGVDQAQRGGTPHFLMLMQVTAVLSVAWCLWRRLAPRLCRRARDCWGDDRLPRRKRRET